MAIFKLLIIRALISIIFEAINENNLIWKHIYLKKRKRAIQQERDKYKNKKRKAFKELLILTFPH